MTREELRSNPFFWSRLGFCYDPPRADKDGNQIIFSKDYAYYRKTHDAFRDAGVEYHTTILHSGWVDDQTYDYRLTDEILHALLDGNPDIKYMPRVKLNAPVGWCKNHPEDVCVYYNGPREKEEIRDLIGTPRHDYFGYENDGYSVNGGTGVYKDDRPNFGGLVALQSFSSEQWRKDAEEALRRLIRHIQEGPFAKQIVGYHVAYGMCGETAMWGGWAPRTMERRGDYGINHQKNFLDFALRKYGSEEALLARWEKTDISECGVPAPRELEGIKGNLRDFFFDETQGQQCADWYEFNSLCDAESVRRFCHVVKEELGEEAVAGAFYGYTYMASAANLGYLAIQELIASPDVDFIASPKGYYRCLAGDPGGEQGPSQSMNRRIAWLDEIDNHTHLDRRPEGRAANPLESETVLTREAVKNLSQGQGFWWMDLGEGWFDTPELMALIAKLTDMERELGKREHKNLTEVLIVVDEKSVRKMSPSWGLTLGLLCEMQTQCRWIGAPVDTFCLCDLDELDLSQYKLIVFANSFYLEKGQRERLMKRIPEKATVVWHYAAGIMAPAFSLENVAQLTGFSIEETADPAPGTDFGYTVEPFLGAAWLEHDFPMFCIKEQPDLTVINRYPDGKIMSAEKMRNPYAKTVLSAFPSLKTADFRRLAEDAGVHLLAPVDCTVYADNRIIGFFPKADLCAEVALPEGCTLNGKTTISLDLPFHGSAAFLLDE